MQAIGSVMTNKYSEGYPGARYYGGNEYVHCFLFPNQLNYLFLSSLFNLWTYGLGTLILLKPCVRNVHWKYFDWILKTGEVHFPIGSFWFIPSFFNRKGSFSSFCVRQSGIMMQTPINSRESQVWLAVPMFVYWGSSSST